MPTEFLRPGAIAEAASKANRGALQALGKAGIGAGNFAGFLKEVSGPIGLAAQAAQLVHDMGEGNVDFDYPAQQAKGAAEFPVGLLDMLAQGGQWINKKAGVPLNLADPVRKYLTQPALEGIEQLKPPPSDVSLRGSRGVTKRLVEENEPATHGWSDPSSAENYRRELGNGYKGSYQQFQKERLAEMKATDDRRDAEEAEAAARAERIKNTKPFEAPKRTREELEDELQKHEDTIRNLERTLEVTRRTSPSYDEAQRQLQLFQRFRDELRERLGRGTATTPRRNLMERFLQSQSA